MPNFQESRGRFCSRARLAYLHLLWREFRFSLIAFLVMLFAGSLAVWRWHEAHLSLPESLWGVFTLIFFQPVLDFPEHPVLEIIFFVIPVVSMLLVVEGLMRFGALVLNRRNNLEVWNMALAKSFTNHVVVSGMGKIGTRVARLLAAEGETLVCVEKNTANLRFDELEKQGAALIVGDILSDDIMGRTNLEKAKCFMALTDNDLANFESVLKARSINPGIRVVLRLYNDSLATRMQDTFNISIVYSSSALAAPSFAYSVYSRHIKDSFEIDGERYCLVHCPVDEKSPFAGLTQREMGERFEATLIVHKDSRKNKKPHRPEEPVGVGDNLICIMPLRIIRKMNGAV